MTKEQKAAKEFAMKWKDHGAEKQESQIFWLELMEKVLGAEHPMDLVRFEEKVRQVDSIATIYPDDETGIAVVYDNMTGCLHSVHPNVCSVSSVFGSKRLARWKQKDHIVQAGERQYNIDRIAIDIENKYDRIAVDECMCDACRARRKRAGN